MKEKPITRVFVAPRSTRKLFLSVLAIMFPIIAACPEPRPGRKEHKGEAISEPRRGLKRGVFIFSVDWGGIFVLFFIERIKFEAPNNPVRRGRRLWFISRLKVIHPSAPVKRKTKRAFDFCFSDSIRNIDARIKR